jgi:transcriptional regulator with XRE-family HTH domain
MVLGESQMLDLAAVTDTMKSTRQLVVEWIDKILIDKNWNGTDLARKAELAPSTILRLLNDPKHTFVPSMRTLQKVSDATNIPIPPEILEVIGKGTEDQGSMLERRKHAAQTFIHNVTVKHVSALPEALRKNVTPKEGVTVPSPPQLDGDTTAFAFYVPDNSMDPVYKSGQLVFATQHRDALEGDTVLVTDKQGKSRIRMLLSIDETGFGLSKSLPAKVDETLSFDELSDIAIVVAAFK